jgi:MFS family permease
MDIQIAPSVSSRDQRFAAKVLAAGICAIVLTVGIARFAYTPLLPVMREHAGLSGITAGWLATVNFIGYLGGALIASRIPSLHQKYTLYRAGLVFAVLSTIAMGLTDNAWVWLALRLIAGWASTAGMLLSTGFVLNWLTRHGHRPELGVHFSGFGAGMLLSGAAIAVMSGRLSWNEQWIALGLLGIIFLIPAWRWMPEPPRELKKIDSISEGAPSTKWMLVFCIAYFCGGIDYVITSTFVVDIVHGVRNLHFSGNGVWIVMGCVAIPSCFVWDRIAHEIGELKALTLAYSVQTVAIALSISSDHPGLVITGAALFGTTIIGSVSLTLSIVGRLFPANPAKAMAKLTLGFGVAQILGPVVAGYLLHASGSYRDALMFATIVGVVGTILTSLLNIMKKA